MRRKNVINFIEMKHKVGSILIWMMLLILAVFAVEVYADIIVGGTEGEIANEKTMVRLTSNLSKGASVDNKITVASLGENLDRYAGSGRTTVAEYTSTSILVTFTKTGNQYEVDINRGPLFDRIGILAPYIPLGFSQVPGTDLETGFVVQDTSGNQYVWIEVPRTTEVYSTAGLSITEYTDADYRKIEDDLQAYTTTYRNGTSYTDDFYSEEASGLTMSEYNIQKKKMLKSVYKNGGFYIGRYETGTNTARTAAGTASQTPVIKQNAYPYNYVTTSQAQELSESFATDGYTSSLLFGVQWDLILKYLEAKGAATQAELNEDSTNWGNFNNTVYNITNTNAKYSSDYGSTWVEGAYGEKSSGTNVLLSTGSNGAFSKQNIFDLAGNVWETTLENNSDSSAVAAPRGGGYTSPQGSETKVSYRGGYTVDTSYARLGFRVALYKDEGIRADGTIEELPYLPTGYTQVAGTGLDGGLVIQDSKGNQYVWVEVPRTLDVYQTAGLVITNFTDAEYEKIENDLQDYTSTYRKTGYADEYYSDATTGLTELQYNIQKKKMLKSIYKNGGFYVGRYETGIADSARTATGAITKVPVIQQNAYPYNYVTNTQAQDLAKSFETEGVQTSLMFGVQWDLMLRYIEMMGTEQVELTEDSTEWGNYKNNEYNITNADSKYYNGSWNTSAYGEKSASTNILLSSGANDELKKQNIYDIAGNVWEWTLEYSGNTSMPVTGRGGCFLDVGTANTVSARSAFPTTEAWYSYGFRVSLYKDEGIGADDVEPTYIPSGYAHVPGTDMETGYVVQDPYGNQYVWIEVPRTSTVYPTAGTEITDFSIEAYTKIENDLHTYTSVYRNGTTYVDEYYSEEATGLTNAQYSLQKRKMLNSIYKNEGFYVGRYEAGSDAYRSTSTESLQTAKIQKNLYPYGNVTTAQAQSISSGFASSGYISSLMFGIQWDLVLKYLETKGTTQSELITDSSNWGNYYSSEYNITNPNAKYNVVASDGTRGSWVQGIYGKSANGDHTMLTTGSNYKFSKQNIYDLAGNVYEQTLEYSSNSSYPLAFRGAEFWVDGSVKPVSSRHAVSLSATIWDSWGFRVALYTDEDVELLYTISYNMNGGTGTIASQIKSHGENITLSSTIPTRTNYTFLGWSTSSTATSATYSAGGTFTTDADTTLYAVWKYSGSPIYTYTGQSTFIDDGNGNWRIKFLTSGTLTITNMASTSIDIFCVGGGGGGGSRPATGTGGGGGGGGYTTTGSSKSITLGTPYTVTIGAGGAVNGGRGGTTSFNGVSAAGGYGGSDGHGGAGGSGRRRWRRNWLWRWLSLV